MRTQNIKLLAPLAAALLAGGCMENTLALENPNQRTTETFWQTQNDAIAGMNAAYRVLYEDGLWSRNRYWVLDHRADFAESRSPAGNIFRYARSQVNNYDDGFLNGIWNHPWQGVFAANQVIHNVPSIETNPALRDRIVAEAKFMRGYLHAEQAVVFGDIPIMTELPVAGDDPEFRPIAEVYAQVEKDATEAAAVLPWNYTGDDIGRATKGAALMLLAETQMMQKKWAAAVATLQQIVSSGQYSLLPNYATLFTREGENSAESIFEVQHGTNASTSLGARGNVYPRLVGPSGAGFNDSQPTDAGFMMFFEEPGRSYPDKPDPRLEYTFFWNKPGGMDVMGRTFASRYARSGPGGTPGFRDKDLDHTYFMKKYMLYWEPPPINFDNDLNFKIYRYGMTLLYLAEALTETNQVAAAAVPLNQLRARVGLPPVPTGMTQQQMRDWINREFVLELAQEHKRMQYLKRQGLYTKEYLSIRNPLHGANFINGKSELMPIPQDEIDLNVNAQQNPGW